MEYKDFSIEELLTVNIAKELGDEEVGFIGMGTGGKSWLLAEGIPMAACIFARLTHAPGFVPMLGPIVEPDLYQLPSTLSDYGQITWRSKAQIPVQDCLSVFRRGKMDKSFVSAAQIDKYGNLNSVTIGDYDNPKVRLVGCIAQSDHMAYRTKNIVMMEHEKRRFVEKVDFISGAGYLDGKITRESIGLAEQGPYKVFTNLAVLDFTKQGRMRLESIHPGVDIQEIYDNTGFELIIPDKIKETPKPTEKEIMILREKVDPEGLLLKGKMG